jgi:phosphate transport system substrate-binding protein
MVTGLAEVCNGSCFNRLWNSTWISHQKPNDAKTMNAKIQIIGLSVLLCLLFMSCDNYMSADEETILSGHLKLGVDDSYSLMMESQIFVYEHLNKYSDIQASYYPESKVMELLLADSIQAAVVSRGLREDEMSYFRSMNRSPESYRIAVDAVVLAMHPSRKDTIISMPQLERIFKGQDTLWSQVFPGSQAGPIRVVFDHNGSCNTRTIMNKFKLDKLPATCFAMKSNQAVLEYVNAHRESIGMISFSWIADEEDSIARANRSLIRTVAIVDPDNDNYAKLPRMPHQGYIYDRSYPLTRDVYYVRTGLRGTLGTGFANHLQGERGQLIIHKTGMVATQTPTRIIRAK